MMSRAAFGESRKRGLLAAAVAAALASCTFPNIVVIEIDGGSLASTNDGGAKLPEDPRGAEDAAGPDPSEGPGDAESRADAESPSDATATYDANSAIDGKIPFDALAPLPDAAPDAASDASPGLEAGGGESGPPPPDAAIEAGQPVNCSCPKSQMYPVNVSGCGLLDILLCTPGGFIGDPACGEAAPFLECVPSKGTLSLSCAKAVSTRVQRCQ